MSDEQDEAVERRDISPTRWLVFEVSNAQGGPETHVWLRRCASPDPAAWIERKRERLRELVIERGYELVGRRPDLDGRYLPRTTVSGLKSQRGRIVERLTRDGYVVVPDDPVEVYAIELSERSSDGRTRVYVGVTSDLSKRLAEHRGEVPDGKPPGQAVKRFGFGRYRADLVEDFRSVPAAAALELEAQVSALLTHQGYRVHGDGVRREPKHTQFVSGISWQDLIAAYETANQ